MRDTQAHQQNLYTFEDRNIQHGVMKLQQK